jgi:predicted lipid-binding transport protein (Tim44 family)
MRLAFFAAALLISLNLLASAGGGGGGGSDDSGGGDGILMILYYIAHLLPVPYNYIAMGGILILFFLGSRKKVRARSGFNQIASFDSIDHKQSKIPADFMQRNPAFSEQVFLKKVETAFLEIQQAWMQQDLSKVRKWISDGVWQRFNTQFLMMQALGQKNTMSDIRIRKMLIDGIQRDNAYDIVDVAIHFTMQDNFITEGHDELNVEGSLENVEYWTFIRKTGVAEKDMFHSQNCPNCGGQLPEKMGEISKCEHCGSITSLGEYDWVLAEITQSVDYANENKSLEKNGSLTERIRQSVGNDPDFSIQLAEDKASNAYMQILSALVMKKPERMRRFVSDALFNSLSEKMKQEPPFIFNRLYLNNVTVMDIYQDQGKNNMVVAFKRTSQRVLRNGNQVEVVDAAPYTSQEVMIMSRDIGAGKPKGSLYAHSCPNCAGPAADTLDLACVYCGAPLNSTKSEWIISGLMDSSAYAAQVHARYHMSAGTTMQDLDPVFKVRDYAFNNIMMIVMADGQVSAEEMNFVNSLAKKYGYETKKIAGLFELAKNRQLSIRLPDEKSKAEEVYKLMEKAASSDGQTSAVEKQVLDDVRRKIESMAAQN